MQMNENMKLPEGWKVEPLDTICKLSYGKNLPTEKFIDDGKYPVYGANGLIGFYVDYTHKDEVVLVSCRGEYSGVINLSQPFSFITNNSITLEIKNNNEIFTRFLLYRIKIIPKQTFVSGSAQPQVVINDLKRLIITIPKDFNEQQKIAEILETVDRAIEKTDKIFEKYKRIKQGLMQDLLTKGIDENGQIRNEKTHKFKNSPLGRIPEEWEVVRLGEVITLEYGKGLPETKRIYGEYPVHGSNGIVGFHNKFLVKGPGIIVGRKGSMGAISWCKTHFWPIDTTYFVTLKTPTISKEWLYIKLISLDLTRLSLSDIVPGLNRKLVYLLQIPLPPLPEQQRIAEILSQIDNTIEKEEAYKQKLERIKKGLMEDLLTGRVRVNHLIKEGKNEK